MTILPIRLSDNCHACGEHVRVYQDYPSGRVIVRGFIDLLPHLCPGDDRGPEEITEVTMCPTCGVVSDDELIGQVARTNYGRLIEWYHPGPWLPYEIHQCVPFALIKQIMNNPNPLRDTLEALKRGKSPKAVDVPRAKQ